MSSHNTQHAVAAQYGSHSYCHGIAEKVRQLLETVEAPEGWQASPSVLVWRNHTSVHAGLSQGWTGKWAYSLPMGLTRDRGHSQKK